MAVAPHHMGVAIHHIEVTSRVSYRELCGQHLLLPQRECVFDIWLHIRVWVIKGCHCADYKVVHLIKLVRSCPAIFLRYLTDSEPSKV